MAEVVLSCKYCKDAKSHVRGCDLCGTPICSAHAHFVSIKETTIKGVSYRTIRICKDCKPRR